MKHYSTLLLVALLSLWSPAIFSQSILPATTASTVVWAKLGKGVNVMTADSSFSLQFRLRVQTLSQARTDAETFTNGIWETYIQRLRLRFEGFLFSPKLLYKVQFTASNRDMESQRNTLTDNPGVLRDAVLQWRFAEGWQIDFGQSKVPGNRQRVVSSQRQEFVDRSNANAVFNLDRDIGVTLRHEAVLGNIVLKNALALTNGEGRNRIATPGNAITGRVEIQPFGKFHEDGDNSESDLYREPTPRFAIAAVYSANTNTTRTGGQLGIDLFRPVTINTFIADALWKYNGLSVSAEYFRRFSENPLSINPNNTNDIRFVYNGMGFNMQSTYIFPSGLQAGARYTLVTPSPEIARLTGERNDYVLCLAQYLSGHDLKVMSDFSYITQFIPTTSRTSKTLQARLQVEFAL